jgi:hypothetical protein
VKYLDPDGRVINIEGDDQFKTDVQKSIDYLKQSKTGKMVIEELEKTGTVFTIKKCDWLNNLPSAEGGDSYDDENKIIYWNANWTIEASNGKYNCPAICLMHEFVHAFTDRTENGKAMYNQFLAICGDKLKDPKYYKPREEFATAMEQKIAAELGEPSGRRRYLDLHLTVDNYERPRYYYTTNIKVPSPLFHSNKER